MSMQTFTITKQQLPKMWAWSLQGLVYEAGLTRDKGPLKLVFQGSSLDYCRKNNGPELLIMPDFTVFSIVESVIDMQKKGWDIQVELQELD